jgi:hypothetical protein
MAALGKIPVVKMGGGYLKAILLNGHETVFGCGVKELIGRLKMRAGVLPVRPERIEQSLEIRR